MSQGLLPARKPTLLSRGPGAIHQGPEGLRGPIFAHPTSGRPSHLPLPHLIYQSRPYPLARVARLQKAGSPDSMQGGSPLSRGGTGFAARRPGIHSQLCLLLTHWEVQGKDAREPPRFHPAGGAQAGKAPTGVTWAGSQEPGPRTPEHFGTVTWHFRALTQSYWVISLENPGALEAPTEHLAKAPPPFPADR